MPNDVPPAPPPGTIRSSRRSRNEQAILEAALDAFSACGFRGATLDRIAEGARLSKPNLLYYFSSKEDIHARLLTDLLGLWLAPLRAIDAEGDPRTELRRYIHGKLKMSRDFPRESRLFANEILSGAPRLDGFLRNELRPLVQEIAALLRHWADQGRIAPVEPMHLIFAIWALTQHYADFATQIEIVTGGEDPFPGALVFLDTLFDRLLTPAIPENTPDSA